MRISFLTIAASGLLLFGCSSAPVRPATAPTAPTGTPHLTATKFVAFGDSMTEGFVQRCPGSVDSLLNGVSYRLGIMLAQGRALLSPAAYPVQLHTMLAERYSAQQISVINEGAGGEEIDAGVAALPRVLTTDAPEVLLLQEGINTINSGHAEGVTSVVSGLQKMIREARGRGLTVFVGTLLPQREGGCRAYDYADEHDDIIPANMQIRALAGTEGAVLVDLYEAFNGQTARLIGEDGLHPSAAGYRVVAETFFQAIRRRLEE